jgi:chaperonin cofactor prefoldin
MELTRSQELIKQLKEIKETHEITYPRIIERMEKNGKYVSLTTLRRVFAEGSETNASNFNYESTLLPIAEALLNVEDLPTPENSPYAKEIDGLKAVIHVQNEEIARLHELKEHLEERITFLLEQIDKKDRRMDEKEETIQKLMNKYVLNEE